MSEYKKHVFDKLLIPVHKLKDKKPTQKELFKLFPVIYKHAEFKVMTAKPFHIILKYIVYCYDKKSPLMEIDDLAKRKIEAASLAGFERDEHGIKPVYMDMMKCHDEKVNKMIVRFCRMQGSITFSHLVANTEAYYNIMEELVNKTKVNDPEERLSIEKKRVEIAAKANDLIKNIEELKRDFIANDTSKELDLQLFEELEEEANKNLMITPEQITDGEAF